MNEAPKEARVKKGSGNVFTDLGLPDAQDALTKAKLAHRICEEIARRKLTQLKAAEILGLDQPKVSALMRGKFDGFSTDRLFRLLNALGQDVEIIVRPAKSAKRGAGVHVSSA